MISGLGARREWHRICLSRYLLASARKVDDCQISWQILILESARQLVADRGFSHILCNLRFGLVMIKPKASASSEDLRT